MNATLGELMEYILVNRKGNAFKNELEHNIANDILNASKDGTVLYHRNKEGALDGIVIAVDDKAHSIMFIQNILCTTKGVLELFVSEFSEQWPFHTLTAMRKGKEVTYNTERFIQKIMNKQLTIKGGY